MDLILHIGTEKTGTTALQHSLAGQRQQLLAGNVGYFDSLGHAGNHRRLSVYARDPSRPDDAVRTLGLAIPGAHAEYRRQTERLLDEELTEHHQVETWIASGEHMHSRLTTQAEVDCLADLLLSRFSSVTVVAVLRPQVELALSQCSTASRAGWPVAPDLLDRVTPAQAYYNYWTLWQRWSQAFGVPN